MKEEQHHRKRRALSVHGGGILPRGVLTTFRPVLPGWTSVLVLCRGDCSGLDCGTDCSSWCPEGMQYLSNSLQQFFFF